MRMRNPVFVLLILTIAISSYGQIPTNHFNWNDSTFEIGSSKIMKLSWSYDHMQECINCQNTIDSIVYILNKNKRLEIKILANMSGGNMEYNKKVTERRAKNIVDSIIEKGINKDRLSYNGNGNCCPIILENDEILMIRSKQGEQMKSITFKKGNYLTDDFIEKLNSVEEKEAARQLNGRTEVYITNN